MRPTWMLVTNTDEWGYRRKLVINTLPSPCKVYVIIDGARYTNAEECSPPKWWPKEWV